LERGWRWCKRNPALAVAWAAVLLVFAAGTTISTILAVVATGAQGNAEREAANARTSAGIANREKADAVAARKDVEEKSDELVTSVARILLRPLALPVKQNQLLPTPTSDPEI